MEKTIKNITSLIILGILLIVIVSCDVSRKYNKEERAQIDNYLNSNPTLDFELKASGLYYLEITPGAGDLPRRSDTAFVKYTGTFLDGTIFDSNVERDDTLVRPVDEGWLIPGMDEGITYMRVGGKSLLLIPSSLAYGPAGWYPIPGYTPLLIELELVRLKPGP
ncbi:MAG: FKBP-type peptidyl-prolyl cis-trans isomerase [Bacteroidales bacterium]|nr:FKBP-type peptidyl-prolyl cis-trans isomerase [Bacteroidales bacterium]